MSAMILAALVSPSAVALADGPPVDENIVELARRHGWKIKIHRQAKGFQASLDWQGPGDGGRPYQEGTTRLKAVQALAKSLRGLQVGHDPPVTLSSKLRGPRANRDLRRDVVVRPAVPRSRFNPPAADGSGAYPSRSPRSLGR